MANNTIAELRKELNRLRSTAVPAAASPAASYADAGIMALLNQAAAAQRQGLQAAASPTASSPDAGIMALLNQVAAAQRQSGVSQVAPQPSSMLSGQSANYLLGHQTF